MAIRREKNVKTHDSGAVRAAQQRSFISCLNLVVLIHAKDLFLYLIQKEKNDPVNNLETKLLFELPMQTNLCEDIQKKKPNET